MVVLRFAWGTDMDFAALNTREKVDGVRGSLPQSASRPYVLRTDPRSEPIMALSVAGDTDLWTLKDLSESVFARRLVQIDGVAEAAVTGGLTQEIHVDVDMGRLESYGLTIQQVSQALAEANRSAPSGTIKRGRFSYSLRTLGELQDVNEIGDIVVAQRPSAGGAPAGRVFLRDVATIEDGFRERESIARYNGKESVGLLVFKESGSNTVRVAKEVEKVIGQLRTDYPQVQLDIAMSQAGFVASAISNLIQEMILGGVLAFLVLVLFLRDPRYPIAIALAIPISVITTFALFHMTGVSINIMSLGGLALGVGMLMDNSIVVIENIFRHKEKGLLAGAAAALGTEEVQRAITASTLTTIAVFGPIIYVEGVAGELFASLSLAVAFSLMASLLVAVTLLPALASRWTGDVARVPKEHGALYRFLGSPLRAFDRLWAGVERVYHSTLESALRHRARVVILSAIALALTIPVAMSLPRSMLPEVDQGEFRARIELPRGTPLEETAQVAAQLEKLLRDDAAVDAVFTRVGRQAAVVGMDEENSGLNTALLEVRLKDGEVTRPLFERLRPKLGVFPPRTVTLETGQATQLGKLLGAGEADLAVRVRGDELDKSMAYAGQVARALGKVPEVTNVRMGAELGQPEFLIEIDRERAAVYGVSVVAIANAVQNAMGGSKATDFVEFDRKVPIIVRLPDDARTSLATLNTLRVGNVPLRELISVRESVGPVEIQRLGQSRFVPVYADAIGRDVEGAVGAVREAMKAVPPTLPMRYEIGGENEEMRRSFRELAVAFTLAVLLVYMILAAEFESMIHPFTVLLSVPLGLIGAIIALWLFGAGINTVSLIGMVILVGIVDNDAVVKIDFINQMRREGLSTRDAILAAGRERLRPIVMNSLTAMLAILPMMFGIGAGAGLQAPLAIAVFGGLLTATVLTLIVIPVVYELFDDLQNWLLRRGGRSEVVVRVGAAPDAVIPDSAFAGGRAGDD
jgi:hydrophobic/amphiphilic exporter-1 (mainly G- bacteria), HAE1 family